MDVDDAIVMISNQFHNPNFSSSHNAYSCEMPVYCNYEIDSIVYINSLGSVVNHGKLVVFFICSDIGSLSNLYWGNCHIYYVRIYFNCAK